MPAPSFALFGLALLAAASEPIRLPVTLVRSTPVTTITVGDQTVQAIVDTGGGVLMLSREVIEAAGGVKLADTQVSNDALGNEYVHARFRMPIIDIGGRALRDTVVIEAPSREAGNSSPVLNVIGRPFLSQYFVVVDYAAGAITLWLPDPGNADRANCGRTRIPMEQTEEEHLAVSVFETQSGRLRLAWDTGAMYSMLPVAMAEKLRPATIARGDTKFYPSRMLTAAGQDFGPLEFVLLPLQPPKDFQGMLGANFFAQHVVCFDYARRELRVR
jgi:predicted aspartyl protease